MDIHVMTLLYGDIPCAEHSQEINSTYCKTHGYKFTIIRPDDPPLSDRDPVWYKVKGVKDGLAGHSHVLFLDADAYFFDHSRGIEQLVSGHMASDHLFLFGYDAQDQDVCWARENANCGVFVVKNEGPAHDILQEWWDLPTADPGWGAHLALRASGAATAHLS